MSRVMIDAEKCDGCKNCSAACMQAHRTEPGSIYNLDFTDPANESRNYILLSSDKTYVPLFCRHCDDPECVMACVSGAMTKDAETGVVLYDKDKCAACFMCVMNCPYGVLKPDRVTRKAVIKCDSCINDPEGQNCVRACPKKAIYLFQQEGSL